MPPNPRSVGVVCPVRGAGGTRGTQRTPGADRVKDDREIGWLDRVLVASCGSRPHFRTAWMTLGNGYLGSRIDEERSEMRYLV